MSQVSFVNQSTKPLLVVGIPLHLKSVANLREHWATKAKRVKIQRGYVRTHVRHGQPMNLGNLNRAVALLTLGEVLEVTLIRVGPRKLDDDNLASAFKHIRDQMAHELGVDDGGDSVRWTYRQERAGNNGIRIEVRPTALEERAR